MPGLSAINAGRRLTACQYHHLDHPRLCSTYSPTHLQATLSHVTALNLPAPSAEPARISFPSPPHQLHSFQFDRYASVDAKPTPPLALSVSNGAGEVDAMTLTAPATATGSTLVMVDRHQAGGWQQVLASLGRRLLVGWDPSGERSGGVAGY